MFKRCNSEINLQSAIANLQLIKGSKLNMRHMPLHEQKSCPRCGKPFECKAGDIGHCQCVGIALNAQERAFIEVRYDDCLCATCLKDLQNKYTLFKEKFLQ
jgi:hypothetical protein